jgi:hypothetical protein
MALDQGIVNITPLPVRGSVVETLGGAGIGRAAVVVGAQYVIGPPHGAPCCAKILKLNTNKAKIMIAMFCLLHVDRQHLRARDHVVERGTCGFADG